MGRHVPPQKNQKKTVRLTWLRSYCCPWAPVTALRTIMKHHLHKVISWLRAEIQDLDGSEYFKTLVQPTLTAQLPHKPNLHVLPFREARVPPMGGLLIDVQIPQWRSSTEAAQRHACSGERCVVGQAPGPVQRLVGERDGFGFLSGSISTGGSACPDLPRWLRRCSSWASDARPCRTRSNRPWLRLSSSGQRQHFRSVSKMVSPNPRDHAHRRHPN